MGFCRNVDLLSWGKNCRLLSKGYSCFRKCLNWPCPLTCQYHQQRVLSVNFFYIQMYFILCGILHNLHFSDDVFKLFFFFFIRYGRYQTANRCSSKWHAIRSTFLSFWQCWGFDGLERLQLSLWFCSYTAYCLIYSESRFFSFLFFFFFFTSFVMHMQCTVDWLTV